MNITNYVAIAVVILLASIVYEFTVGSLPNRDLNNKTSVDD